MTPEQMKITINNSITLAFIRDEFNKYFPYLRLEFFSKPHHANEGSHKKAMLDVNLKVGECRKVTMLGDLTIIPDMTVVALEQQFWSNYGLTVQVFRKSGRIWLETTVTDAWTLEKQNAQGMSLNEPVAPEKPDYNELIED